MKRTIAILVVTIYGILAVGVHLHLHYCCGKLAGIEFQGNSGGCCDTENGQACMVHKQCCSFESIDLSIDDEHRAASFVWMLPLVSDAPSHAFLYGAEEKTGDPFVLSDGPPPSIRLFLRHSSLVLYA